jgi:two-component system phosphate regulon sensor histidine kinase PhoR
MTDQRRQLVLASATMVGLFGLFEIVKTALFPHLSSTISHISSTVAIAIMSAVTARYVLRQHASLSRERERSFERLREALAAAERSANLLRAIVASIDQGLVITDQHSRVLLVNDAARRLLGIADREAVRLTDITRDPHFHRAFQSVLKTGEHVVGRVEAWTSESSTQNRRVLSLFAAPLKLSGRAVDGVVGTLIDVTKLEKLEKVRQEFLANASHELRTPLSSILAYVETLVESGLSDQELSLRFLRTVQRNAERMRALVNDIAELAAIESGAIRLTLSTFRLRPLIDEVFNGLAPRVEQLRIKMINDVPEGFVVTADRRRMEQILTNLVDNAVKFNRHGGSVWVNSQVADDGSIALRVRDSGHGIPADHLGRVFERFYRVDQARSREAGGTGLGLAIVKHLARAHAGEALVTSQVGEGTEFTIKLPYREVQPNAEIPVDRDSMTTATVSTTDGRSR